MIQAASKRLNLNSPTSAISSSDENTIQLVALAQEEGKSLARRHPWQILITEKTFTSTAAAAQVGAIPTDFDRFVDESFYNRTQKRPVHGPISPQDWQLIGDRLDCCFREFPRPWRQYPYHADAQRYRHLRLRIHQQELVRERGWY